MTQAMRALHQQMAHMQLQMEQQMQQQQLRQQQLSVGPSHGSAQQSSRSSFQPRLNAPPAYEGKAAALDEWEVDMQQQFDWYRMDAEADRVHMAAAFLKGPARDWYIHLPAAERDQIRSWPQMMKGLRKRFQPVTTAEVARQGMWALTQGKGTIHTYVAAYRKLAVQLPEMHEEDKLFAFSHGLKESLQLQLKIQGVATVEEAINMAVRIGTMGEYTTTAQQRQQQQTQSASSGSGSSGSGGAPMDIDAMMLAAIEGLEQETGDADSAAPANRQQLTQLLNAIRDQRANRTADGFSGQRAEGQRGLPRIKGMTPAQVKEHMDEGKCFGCGKKDHRSRQCPLRRVATDGKVTWAKNG